MTVIVCDTQMSKSSSVTLLMMQTDTKAMLSEQTQMSTNLKQTVSQHHFSFKLPNFIFDCQCKTSFSHIFLLQFQRLYIFHPR